MQDLNHQHQDPTMDSLSQRRALLAGLGGLAAGAFLAGKAHAGPLNPPPGPIAPTPGPEPRIAINEVNTPGGSSANFYTITQPGSYYLTADTTVPSDMRGIVVAAENVTIDLCGFTLRGTPGSDGIVIGQLSGVPAVCIRNGVIEGWRNGVSGRLSGGRIESLLIRNCNLVGINADLGTGLVIRDCVVMELNTLNVSIGISIGNGDVTIERCAVHTAGVAGIRSDAGRVTIRECSVRSVNGDGIAIVQGAIEGCRVDQVVGSGYRSLGGPLVVRNCQSSQCSNDGFRLDDASVVSDCIASGCLRGFQSENTCTFTNCVADASQQDGFDVGAGCVLSGCIAGPGGGRGFVANIHAVMSDCVAFNNNGNGFETQTGATLINCTARNNAGNGIQVSSGSTVNSCTARGNTLDGFVVASASKVTNCSASSNGNDGFQLSTDIYISGCSADEHAGGAGINVATGSDNRIEANNLTDNGTGLLVQVAGNAITRNSASGNSVNYSIVPGNDVGPIGSAATSTSPWANLQF